MKKLIVNLLSVLVLTFLPLGLSADVSTSEGTSSGESNVRDTETYVCTVTAIDSMYGETRKVNIYLLDTDWGGKMYIGREVVNGHEKSVYGEVYFNDDSKYKYWVKTGMVGICYFNTTKLNDKYVKNYF